MNKLKKLAILASVLLLQPIMTPDSAAWAKRRTPPKAFSFIAEGGKASQGECDGERKIPRLKRLKEFSGASSYMGSELQDPEIKGKPGEEMWKHFFRAKPACNSVLAKTPSSVNDNLAKAKPDVSSEEDSEEAAENADEKQEIENAEAEPATE
ncbi:hypothetical protein AB1A81_12320 [Bdellovibrio bacteriovorus]|uniref:Uncharacterized protein n=1 Tax=Bdellovibrio bacteriovorus (strain ATCC 15356 / DSM 50701 / NCIMB 9529 / HD100) TaxID=264462 RepID=Q6MJT3_BDEBA|nr:hypothetical protein [Bdellovibrio bacteriovorus]AHZ85187.1 hypothetical protein EP01_09595 [Bdellovibrio bacteriovorus]BEV69079.1 hypothetical protein Bb109J_c2499 [Bdellovibrio bacteriovorus]CAE80476.1 hypothetical protein predicted by Glimmer/Critica [Bdellovibrio bacteriovorus HD100]